MMSFSPADGPIRIGLMFEYGSLNGGEFSLLSVLDELSHDEIDPVALCPSNSPLARALDQREIERHVLPEFPRGNPSDAVICRWAEIIAEMVDGLKLCQLHANSLAMSRRLGRVASRLPCPATGHVRDLMNLSRSAVEALGQLSGLVAVSRAVECSLVSQGVPADKVRCIHNGVDLQRFRPREKQGWLLRELALPPSALLAATIGQICLRKGQNDLAQAAVQLRDRFPELHFLLIGQRHSTKQESLEFDEGITKTFRDAGLSNRLHRLEFREDIPEILNEIDLLIHPARQEPLGRVLLETAASGCPIVATDVGGTREILTHGESGWLVPAGKPEQLAAGGGHLLDDPVFSRQLSIRARAEMELRFPVQQAAVNLLNFWRGKTW